MTLTRRGSAKAKHTARLAWLRPRLADWTAVPGLHQDVTDEGRAVLEVLCDLMKAQGLIAAASREIQRETVRRALSELRGQEVGVGWDAF